MIVGIDVGGTKALALLIDPDSGDIVDRERAASGGDAGQLVGTLAGLVDDLVTRNDAELDGVGLGVAGLASRDGVLRYSPNLPSLIEFPLAAELGERVGVLVTLGNDATTATLAEHRQGAGRGSDDLVLVTLGTGIGVGIVAGGRLIEGANGFAGEAGHMTVDRDGPVHLTGKPGPWEYFGSGTGLGRAAREAAADGRFAAGLEAAGSADDIEGSRVSDALAAGDPEAEAIFEAFCGEVALGVANLVLLLDSERVVLGGGLVDIGEPLRVGVADQLNDRIVGSEHRPEVEVRLAELGEDAGAIGAALLALDSVGRR